MKKNEVKPKPLQDEGKIRVLVFNKRRFVIGLTWHNIRAQRSPMKDIRRIGKEKGLDLVAVRHSDSIQAGFAPKTRLKLRGAFSLTVALASLLEGCCIAVVALGENAEGMAQYTLVGKTERGGIHPWSDSIYTAEEMRQKIIDLRDELRGSKGNIDVPVYGDASISWVTEPLDFEAVLEPKNLSKSFRLTPLTWGLTRGQLMTVGAGIIIGLIGLMIYLHFEGER
ncbi:type 4b pilus protein PilO2, partial [Pantoea agglomerans]|uniref:type 4b pilus protein PilO2 n=1 Tax=Enterobacter agglomerans TaxID=549 RepID=UPI00320B731D